MIFWKQKVFLISVSILIVIPLGLFSKFYQGLAQEWVNNYSGGIWYEIFWCLLAFYFVKDQKYLKLIPIYVFIITCILEILQLLHPPILELFRSYLIGKLLLGTTFSWWDFPHYLIGCFLGYLWLRKIANLNRGTLFN